MRRGKKCVSATGETRKQSGPTVLIEMTVGGGGGGEKHRVINQEPMIKSEEPAGKTPVTKGSRADPAR